MGKTNTIATWWCVAPRPGNMGDIITPVILRHYGITAKWASLPRARLLATGSILGRAGAGQIVWGSGVQRYTDRPHTEAKYLAVRGPISQEILKKHLGRWPAAIGDPALLLPKIHTRPAEKKYDLGVVPHYVDLDLVGKSWHVINPVRKDPLDVVDEIRECRAIVSSSLHGIIVAHAYGIPAAWVRLSGRLKTDGAKFADYAASVGVQLIPYSRIAKAEPVLGSLDTAPLEKALGRLQ